MRLIWLTTALLLIGCSPVKRDLNHALAVQTADAYAEFLQRWPEAREGGEIERRLDALHWEEARSRDETTSYKRYVGLHPQGAHRSEADDRIRAKRIERLLSEGSLEELEVFLAHSPEAATAEEVLAKVDDLWYARAVQQESIRAVASYLTHWPAGRHVPEAREHWDRLLYERARRIDTLSEWERLTDEYPDNAHAELARTRMKELRFRDVDIRIVFQSWRPEWTLEGVRTIVRQIAETLASDLRADGFRTGPVRWVTDGTRESCPERGCLTLVVEETHQVDKGRRGLAVRLSGVLWSPAGDAPVWTSERENLLWTGEESLERKLANDVLKRTARQFLSLPLDAGAWRSGVR